MVTGPADEPDLSVSLPPRLEEWVNERAATLGVDREELLVQVLSAYRAVADLDDGDVPTATDSVDLQERIDRELEAKLDQRDGELEAVDHRVDALESDTDADLDTLRNRVLQLRDAVQNRAATDHTHEEFARLGDRLDGLATDIANVSGRVSELEDAVDDRVARLDTLARVVLTLRNRVGDRKSEPRRQLDQLRRTANRKGVTDGTCESCGESVSIPLLTESACPHCEAQLRDISTTGILFKRAKLTGPIEDDGEAADE